MIREDEAALICDLAETYHIYDYKRLPLTTVGVLSCGLRDDSRIKQKMTNQRYTVDQLLLASISDSLTLLWWAKTEDGRNNRNRPESVLMRFLGKESARPVRAFTTAEEFDAEWKRINGG